MKYPLTDEAKQMARELVAAWESKSLEQAFYLAVSFDSEGMTVMYVAGHKYEADLPEITIGIMRELSRYGLIQAQENPSPNDYQQNFEVTLLQELKNAIANDFDVSEYFLTLNAVGTIVQGDLHVASGGLFQSSATGDNFFNKGIMIADEIEKLLTPDTINQLPALQDALKDLRQDTDKGTFSGRLGRVIEELGRCMGHVNNFYNVVQAIGATVRLIHGQPI